MPSDFLGSPTFWALVFAMACGLIAAYFIMRQAILDALDEHARREREREQAEHRGKL